jgi:hypothetical protein
VAEELHKIFGDILARFHEFTYASVRDYLYKKHLDRNIRVWLLFKRVNPA